MDPHARSESGSSGVRQCDLDDLCLYFFDTDTTCSKDLDPIWDYLERTAG